MAGFTAPVSRLSNSIVDRVYDRQVRYQPNKHFQPHEEDGALSTQPHKSTKVWKQQKVLQYDENPQERMQEKVLAKLVPGKDGRQQIVETTQWPYSMFAQITMKFKGKTYGGSGAFVGPHHVLTCGHNVYDKDDNVWAEDITVYPALNDKHAPFGSVKVVKVFTFTQYTNLKDERYDIALLILNKSIGKYTGWAGMLSAPDNQLSQEQVNIVGYPGDKGMTQMWGMKHTIHQIKPEQFEYLIDTNGGQSGSPIWISKFGAIMILGVHTLGGNYTNTGVRLSTEKFRALVQKIAESYEREKPQGPAPQPILQAPFPSKQPQPSPPLTVSKQPSPQPAPAPIQSRSAMQSTLPLMAFGKEKWAQYFGDVGLEPPLPSDIEEILSQKCPFWPWNKVRDTHLLVLIPATINGQTFTLGTLGQLVRHPKQGYATQFNYVEDGLMSKSTWNSHWVLMTKRVLDDSVGQEDYDAILKHYYKSYKRPTVLEAATCILMEHVTTGEKLYSNNPYTCARCEENDIMIGGFEGSGINVGYYPNLDHIGHAALRPLIAQYPASRAQRPASNVPSPVSTPKEPSQPVVVLPKFKTKPIVSDDWRVRQPISNVPFIRTPSNSQMPEIAFGKAKWAQYFGDIGIEPPLPADIHQILNTPCPIWPDKKIYETHLLTLIPATVNGIPLNLQSLGELVKRPLQGNPTKYQYFSLDLQSPGNYATKYQSFGFEKYEDLPVPSSRWTLFSRDVIPESRDKPYADQDERMSQYPGYELPHILDASVALFMEYVQYGTRLYSDSPSTYTRCQDKIDSKWSVTVGSFAESGLCIPHHRQRLRGRGVGLQRTFY